MLNMRSRDQHLHKNLSCNRDVRHTPTPVISTVATLPYWYPSINLLEDSENNTTVNLRLHTVYSTNLRFSAKVQICIEKRNN